MSNLMLSAFDQAQLKRTLQTLLTPLDYAEPRQWQVAVHRELRALLRADQAFSLLPTAGEDMSILAETAIEHRVHEYAAWNEQLERTYRITRRQAKMRVWSRRLLWQPHLDAFYKSAYYNELIVPSRSYDTIGMSVAVTSDIGTKTVASFMLHHDTPNGNRFGERGLAVLRVINPALEAGVRTLQQLSAERARLGRTVDALGKALMLIDAAGTVVHQSVALTRMLEEDTQAAQVLDELLELGRRMGSAIRPTLRSQNGTVSPIKYVETQTARYRLQGSCIETEVIDSRPFILVLAERLTPLWPSEEQLRERFGVTPQEARVALLLAQGKSNAEIAEALFISTHTARHHTEHVLMRLNRHARAEVAGCLLETKAAL